MAWIIIFYPEYPDHSRVSWHLLYHRHTSLCPRFAPLGRKTHACEKGSITMATAISSNVLDMTTCSLCFERYNKSIKLPKSLPCLHTFCSQCMINYYKSKLKPKLKCPVCSEIFTVPDGGIQNLKTNFMVRNLLEDLLQDTSTISIGTDIPTNTMHSHSSMSTLCTVHKGEVCDYFCTECDVPLCGDCLLSLNDGPHKTHKIIKWKIATNEQKTTNAEYNDIISDMRESKVRINELLSELNTSKSRLLHQASEKRDRAHQEVESWYMDTTKSIDNVHSDLCGEILQVATKLNLDEFETGDVDLWSKLGTGDIQAVKNMLDNVKLSISECKRTNLWPPQSWCADSGRLTTECTINLGRLTQPMLQIPGVVKVPDEGKPSRSHTEKSSEGLNEDPNQRHEDSWTIKVSNKTVRVFHNIILEESCWWNVGLSAHEVLVSYKDKTVIQKVSFKGDVTKMLNETFLPGGLSHECHKYALTNGHYLLREYNHGPTYILSNGLQLMMVIDEQFGCIIGAHSNEWVAFYNKDEISIYHLTDKTLVQSVKLAPGEAWTYNLSVCLHPSSLYMAVVDYGNEKLYVFDSPTGTCKLVQSCVIYFRQCRYYGLACNSRHIYVLGKWSIGIYNWKAQKELEIQIDDLYGLAVNEVFRNIQVTEHKCIVGVGEGKEMKSVTIFGAL